MALPAQNILPEPTLAVHGPFAEDHILLCRAVRAAGAIALGHFKRGVESWDKSPNNPVSHADLEVDHFLREALSKARPDYGWLSEESASKNGGTKAHRAFVVDPIDGTRSFLRGRPEFAVSAALITDGTPHSAVVFNPATDEFFEAIAGGGARLNGEPIHVKKHDTIAGTKMLVSWREFQKLCERGAFVGCEMTPIGSIAYKIALVAAGKAAAVVALAPKNDWDLAAAQLLLTEAGGRITDSKGQSLHYSGAGHSCVVAADPALHALLLGRISET